MVLWGWLIFCSRDFAAWNALFAFINFVHLIVICTHILRPVKFSSVIEEAYHTLFKPLRASRQKFEKILKCKYEIKAFPRGTTYAIEDFTKIETLGLILRGRFKVSRHSKVLHTVSARSFLDAPEWFYATSNDYYQVSITAAEDSEVLIWNKDKLKLTVYGDKFLQTVLDHILSKDALGKLLCLSNIYIGCVDQSNNIISDIPNMKDDVDSSKLLIKECNLKTQVPVHYNYISDTDHLEANEHLSTQDEDYEWDLSQIKEEYETTL
ncbi:Blood vessel epicardial substance-B [Nymphon striatum]|nr:Blood vessel epicardial substance-B [Nymphon striatum]